jgi:hypothetical protein
MDERHKRAKEAEHRLRIFGHLLRRILPVKKTGRGKEKTINNLYCFRNNYDIHMNKDAIVWAHSRQNLRKNS